MKKYLIVSLTFLLFNFQASASHFMGGEITWICLKGGPNVGQYIFQMKVYRDCSGTIFSPSSTTLDHHNYPAVGGMTPILMNFISATDISPTGAAASGNLCFDCSGSDVGAVEEFIWRSDPITLAGSPPPQGWHFTWGTCCRNASISNIMTPSSQDWTLRAIMLPYNDPTVGVLPAFPCYDSSPEFKELPKTIICTGYPFAYSHNASDEELDDLKYFWSEPLGSNLNYDEVDFPNSQALPFVVLPPAPPLQYYSYDVPLPGDPQLDDITGEISYFSNTSGFFVTCVKVEAKKCGQVVAKIYREVQVMLVDCNSYNPPDDGFNDPPEITAPIGTQFWLNTPTPSGLPSYSTTVSAGELVTFDIQAEDLDTYAGVTQQNLTLSASGGQFSSDYIDPLLCWNPPCATFTDGGIPPVAPPFSALGMVSGVFEWQTTCDHIEVPSICASDTSKSSIFTFVIKAEDDFCPANGIRIATLKITVKPPSPDLRCVSVKDNGDIELTWKHLINATPTTEPFYVWHSTDLLGPYSMIGSELFPVNTFTHVGANGNTASQYYFLANKDACDTTGGNLRSDTLRSILMEVTPENLGVTADLNWNSILDPLLFNPLLFTSATNYDLYRKRTPGLFTNYLATPLLTHQYDLMACNEDLQFYVELPDASGCVSRSSVGVVNLFDTIMPIIPVITDVSVDLSGRSVISWIPSPGADLYIIYLVTAEEGVVTIDTVMGGLSSSYTYLISSADQYYETFSVRAEDSCGNTKNITPYHNSIYLGTDFNACSRSLTLNWNEYINWDSNVSHYNLVVEETDLGGLVTTIIDTNLQYVTDYVMLNLKDQFSYSISLVASNGDATFYAASNLIVFVPSILKKPDFNYIEYASINPENGFVEINCLIDNTAIISHYDVMRSLRKDNNFLKIGEMLFPGTITSHYTDEEAKTTENFYQYQIYPVDTCGAVLTAPSLVSIPEYNDTSLAQTILLETVTNLDYDGGIPEGIPFNKRYDEDWGEEPGIENQYTNTLTFNEYDRWIGNVKEYKLYRSINRQPYDLLPINTWYRTIHSEEPLEYIDVVTGYGDGNGRFCYYIEAIEGDATPNVPVVSNLSNISCISQTPIIYVPSVFTPNGDEHNEIFHPVTFYVSEEGYTFTIYNRTGGLIFTTNDPSKGWDGTFNGNRAQDGNYVYHIKYVNGVGALTEKTDMFTLVR